MASFFEDLWNSIFTPGPTPTLLVATNASFAALQLLFFILFISTYSIHFFVLSIISGGLWYSINWFAIELLKEQQKEQQQKESSDRRQASSGDETETDTKPKHPQTSAVPPSPQAAAPPSEKVPIPAPVSAPVLAPAPKQDPPKPIVPQQQNITAITTGRDVTRITEKNDPPVLLRPGKVDSSTDLLRKRRQSLGDSSDYVSTDSEWEKVSDAGEQ